MEKEYRTENSPACILLLNLCILSELPYCGMGKRMTKLAFVLGSPPLTFCTFVLKRGEEV